MLAVDTFHILKIILIFMQYVDVCINFQLVRNATLYVMLPANRCLQGLNQPTEPIT